jgi:hypothetical protein
MPLICFSSYRVASKNETIGVINPPKRQSLKKKRFISQRVHTVGTGINYKCVPVTNLNKYLHYGASGTE